MKICIDARTVNFEKMHGISRCACSLLRHLGNLDKKNTFLIIYRERELPGLLKSFDNYKFHMTNVPPYSIAEQLAIPAILKREHVDLYHVPTYACPLYQPCPTVMTIHDLIHMKFKEDYRLIHRIYFKIVVKTAARRAVRVITDSEVSKNDIVELLGVNDRNVSVVHPGVDEKFSKKLEDATRDGILRQLDIPDRYIMSLGNPKPHKNMKRLVEAYINGDIPESLVVVGVSRGQIRISGERMNKIVFLPSVNDEELRALYQGARLFVFPSLYEGFGLPPLEAASGGVPVVSSDCGACREILGESAYYVRPDSGEEIIRGAKKVLQDENLRQGLSEKGLTRARKFDWEEAARKTLGIYYDILKVH